MSLTSPHTSPAPLHRCDNVYGSLPRVRHHARHRGTGGCRYKSQVGPLQESQPCKYTPPHSPVSPEVDAAENPGINCHLPCAKPCHRWLICLCSCDPCDSTKFGSLTLPFDRPRNGGTKRLGNLQKVTHPVSGKPGLPGSYSDPKTVLSTAMP